MVVSFSPAQFRSQRTESVRVDHGMRLVDGEATTLDEVCAAVVVGCGGDDFVFGSELGGQASPVFLGGDGLVQLRQRHHRGMHRRPVQIPPLPIQQGVDLVADDHMRLQVRGSVWESK